ncbi:HopJ type III effector protein, partial [Acinetobacter baumannii]
WLMLGIGMILKLRARVIRIITFAEHYASVLATPEGTDHQNIRQFMQNGWDGVKFEGQALTEK